jgi:hypothetical protein
MPQQKRANGACSIYVKHGGYYGRWIVPAAVARTGGLDLCAARVSVTADAHAGRAAPAGGHDRHPGRH